MINKIISKIVFLLMLGFVVNGQENSLYVESMMKLVVQDRIPVYNSAYEMLDNTELSNQFIRVDTILNENWTRPKYVDNIYSEPIEGAILESTLHLDTITDTRDLNYLSFFTLEHDDSGNFLGERVVFKIDKRIKPEKEYLDAIEKNLNGKLKWLIKSWMNDKIKLSGSKIELDSCHKLYRIEFEENNTFKQYYLPSKNECFTEEMKANLKVKIEEEAELLIEYSDKLQGHYIKHQTGKWYLIQNKLILETNQGERIMSFVIKKIQNNCLSLSSEYFSYELKFKKAKR